MAEQATEEREDLEVLLRDEDRFSPPEEFVKQANFSDPAIYEEAEADFEAWWEKWAKKLDWFEDWQTVLEWNPPWAKWFKEGKINASHNCLDRHVEAGKGDKVAYHWVGEDGDTKDVTYADLLDSTQRFANVLKSLGVEKGDVVGIFMPMVPETPAAMLACARIGAVHNVVFGGFSVESVKERMKVSDAKVLVTADATLRRGKPTPMKEKVDEILDDLPKLEHVVVVKRTDEDAPMTEGRDVWWHEAVEKADAECEPEKLDAEHPLYILYTSGSTAKPKGILHTTGGYLTGVAATHYAVFDLKPDDDVYWCAADVGWVTGHSYIVYGPLCNGATSVLYEGAPDYPEKDRWWQIVEDYKVTILYTAPTAIRACMKWGDDHVEKHDVSSLRLLGSVGEPINPKAWAWYHKVIGGERCPIVDTWWQTETGQIMITPLPGITETKPGSATRPFPGVEAAVVKKDGTIVEEGGGFLTLRRPWPGMARTLYGEDDRYVETYWTKYGKDVYDVGDASKIDSDGYFWIVGRVDDVINVSGHRMSTMEVESAIVSHDRVAEAAVVGAKDEDTGQTIVAFVTLKGDSQKEEEGFDDEIRAHVADKIGKLARPKRIVYADDLPKTRSGKIMRRLLKDIAEGRELGDVTTLRDPSVTETIKEKIAAGEADEE
ncbi:MAG: acetyl-CoA synthetase [Thermoleophilaceae bacterium]|jgi:acetyl-CoA synthetase|nr:acetyl-CoA synthetase [Thermoleophilaceae bacterium]